MHCNNFSAVKFSKREIYKIKIRTKQKTKNKSFLDVDASKNAAHDYLA